MRIWTRKHKHTRKLNIQRAKGLLVLSIEDEDIFNTKQYRMVLISVKQSYYWPGESLRVPAEFEAPRFQDTRHMNVVRLSALRAGRL